jgi:hypothetical protein
MPLSCLVTKGRIPRLVRTLGANGITILETPDRTRSVLLPGVLGSFWPNLAATMPPTSPARAVNKY